MRIESLARLDVVQSVRSRLQIDVRGEHLSRMEVEVERCRLDASFQQPDAVSPQSKPDDDPILLLSVRFQCQTQRIRMQKAAKEHGSRRNLLDVVVVFYVAAVARIVDAFRHPALHIKVEAACQWPVEPVVSTHEERGLERQSSQVVPIVGC